MNQTDLIYEWLKSGHSLTALEALERFGCFRLGARCYDLRRKGVNVVSQLIEVNGKHISEYKIA